MALHTIHACSGYGGFELGLNLAGIASRTVAHIERESHAASVLVARMENQDMDKAPIWDDLHTFPAEQFHGAVDLITAGLPCQPFSNAGQQRGLDDDRHLWPAFWDLARRTGTRLIFLENVPAVVSAGWLDRVVSDLADSGWSAEWDCVSAADIGAPHRRNRFWLLAWENPDALRSLGDASLIRQPGQRQPWRNPINGTDASRPIQAMGDPNSNRRGTARHGETQLGNIRDASDRRSPAVGNPKNVGYQIGISRPVRSESSFPRAESHSFDVADALGVGQRKQNHQTGPIPWPNSWVNVGWRGFPPTPNDQHGWAEWCRQGGPEPVIRRSAHGTTGRLVRDPQLTERLHLLGNGLVPQAAAYALRLLLTRALAHP